MRAGKRCVVFAAVVAAVVSVLFSAQPAAAASSSSVLSLGADHTCVILDSADVLMGMHSSYIDCFGFNGYGQLFTNSLTSGMSPFGSAPMNQILPAGPGALNSWCPYPVTNYQRKSEALEPCTKQSSDLVGWPTSLTYAMVSAGYFSSCLITHDRRMYCAGLTPFRAENEPSMSGAGSRSSKDSAPVVLKHYAETVFMLSEGEFGTCVIINFKFTMRCYGVGNKGALGTGAARADGQSPGLSLINDLQFPDLAAVVEISSGGNSTCALFSSGQLRCFGEAVGGYDSLVSIGTSATHLPNLPYINYGVTLTVATAAVARGFHCAVFSDGRIKCAGTDTPQLGVMGVATNVFSVGTSPTSSVSNAAFITFSDTIVALRVEASDLGTACALFANGRLRCWGANVNGNIGYDAAIPIGVGTAGLATHPYISFSDTFLALDIAMGRAHTCAIFLGAASNPFTRCWGSGAHKRLGVLAGLSDVGFPPGLLTLGNIPLATAPDSTHSTLVTVKLVNLFPRAFATAPVSSVDAQLQVPAAYVPTYRHLRLARHDNPADFQYYQLIPFNSRALIFSVNGWYLGSNSSSTICDVLISTDNTTFTNVGDVVFLNATSATLVGPPGGPLSGGTIISINSLEVASIFGRTISECRLSANPDVTNGMIAEIISTVQATTTGAMRCSQFPPTAAGTFPGNNAPIYLYPGPGFAPIFVGYFQLYDATLVSTSVSAFRGGTVFTLEMINAPTPFYGSNMLKVAFSNEDLGVYVVASTVVTTGYPNNLIITCPTISFPANRVYPVPIDILVTFNNQTGQAIRFAPGITHYYYDIPVLIGVNPPSVAANAGQVVTIMGSNMFDQSMVSQFDDIYGPSLYIRIRDSSSSLTMVVNGTAQTISDGISQIGSATFLFPSSPIFSERVDIFISMDKGSLYATQFVSMWVLGVSALTFSPKYGPLGGNYPLLITGAAGAFPSDTSNYWCQIGTFDPTNSVDFSQPVTCITPAFTAPGNYTVSISTDDAKTFVALSTPFVVLAPAFTQIIPTSAPLYPAFAGTHLVTVVGSNFPSLALTTMCRYDVNVGPGPNTIVNSTAVLCATPLNTRGGVMELTLSFNGGTHWVSGTPPVYLTFFSIVSVLPASGTSSGGQTVSIIGSGFSPYEPTYCYFGSFATNVFAPVSVATVVNTGMVTCKTPLTTPALYDVVISQTRDAPDPSSVYSAVADPILNPPIGVVTIKVRYMSYSELAITAVAPAVSIASTVVTVYGNWDLYTNFEEYAFRFVKFGSVVVRVDSFSASGYVVASVPDGRGVVVVEGSQNGIDFSSNPNPTALQKFTYLEVLSSFPTMAPFNAASRITVIGRGFDGGGSASCLWGTTKTTLQLYNSDSFITCLTPTTLTVSNVATLPLFFQSGITSNSSASFIFYRPPQVTTAIPRIAYTAGTITIVGAFFYTGGPAGSVQCLFGVQGPTGIVTPGSVFNSSLATCGLPLGTETYNISISFNYGVDYHTSTITDVSFVRLFDIAPRAGPVGGNTVVLLTGSPRLSTFPSVSRCWINGTGFAAINVVTQAYSSATVKCTMPASVSGLIRTVNIEFQPNITSGTPWTVSQSDFYYYLNPVVTAVYPRSIATTGLVPLTVWGTNFVLQNPAYGDVSTVRCKFDTFGIVSASVADLIVSYTGPARDRLICKPTKGVGLVPVEVSLNSGSDFTSNNIMVSFFQIYRLTPNSGPSSGGTNIVVSGVGFYNDPTLTCQIGVVSVPATYISYNKVLCVAPSFSAAYTASVELTSFNGTGGTTGDKIQFISYPAPTVTAIDPSSVPVGYLPTITVYGTAFRNDPSQFRCRFGIKDSQNGTIVMTGPVVSYLLCLLLPGTGEVPVIVSFNAGFTYSVPSVLFRYLEITNVIPNIGPTRGRTEITLRGVGVTGGINSKCRFGANFTAPATVKGSDSVTCILPTVNNTAAGITKVEYTYDGLLYTNNSNPFTYYATPNVTSVYPVFGPASGGFQITLFGFFFPVYPLYVSSVCVFGGIELTKTSPVYVYQTNVTLPPLLATNSTGPNSTAFVTCASPAKDGVQSIDVSFNNGIDTSDNPVIITYFTIVSLSPDSGPAGSDKNVIAISGSGLTVTADSKCRFGPTRTVQAVLSSSGPQVNCLAPADLPPGSLTVEFSADGSSCSTDAKLYTTYTAPVVTGISPPSGPSGGGNLVTVYGDNFFISKTKPKCRFNLIPGDAEFIMPWGSGYAIVCRAPTSVGSNILELSFNDGFAYTTNERTYVYFQVLSITPDRGPTTGKNSVLILGSGFVRTIFQATGVVGYCYFNDIKSPQPLQFVSELQLSCPTPRLSDNDYTLTFSLSNGVVGFGNLIYTGYTQTNFTKITPLIGPVTGGTTVLFVPLSDLPSNVVSCRFGTGSSGIVVSGLVSSTVLGVRITCISPPNSGLVDLGMSFNGVDFDVVAQFQYFSVSLNSPISGPSTGGTIVTVVGQGFVKSPNLSCKFGNIVVKAPNVVYRDANRIECTAPLFGATVVGALNVLKGVNISQDLPVAGAGGVVPTTTARRQFHAQSVSSAFPISVSVDGNDYISSPGMQFSIYDHAHVTAVTPERSVTAGGIQVFLFGYGFPNKSEALLCRFSDDPGTADSPATYYNSTTIGCVTTPHVESAAVKILTSLNGQQYDTADVTIGYFLCPRGTFAQSAKDKCQPCGKGKFSDQVGSRECQICPAETFSDLEVTPQCEKCPANSFIEGIDRTSRDLCLCRKGFYTAWQIPGTECKECPPGALCEGGAQTPIGLPGYYTESKANPGVEVPFVFLECDNPSACPGGVGDRICSVGYTGRLCADCQLGYYKSGIFCRTCPQQNYWTIVAFFVFILIVCVGLFRMVGSDASAYGGTIGIATYYFQIVSVLSRIDLKWPAEVQRTMALLSSPFSLNIDVLASECSLPAMDFKKKWAGMMLVPWFFATLFLLIYLLARLGGAIINCCRKTPRQKQPDTASLGDGLVNAFMMFMVLAYLTLTTTSFQLFDCSVGLDGIPTLDAQPSLVCYEKWWLRLVPVAVFGIVGYSLFTPIYISFALWRARKRLNTPVILGRFGAVYSDYRHKNFYWESSMMTEKFSVGVCLTFFTNFTQVQILAFLLVCVMGLSVHIVTYPYFIKRYNKLQTILRWCACLMIMSGMLFLSGNFPTVRMKMFLTVFVFGVLGGSSLLVFFILIYDVVNIRRSIMYCKFDKETSYYMAKLTTPQGKAVIFEWMGTKPVEEVRNLTANWFLTIGRFYYSPEYLGDERNPGLKANDKNIIGVEIHDRIVDHYIHNIMTTPVIPAVRLWVMQRVTKVRRTADPKSVEDLRALIRVFSELKRYTFYTGLGAKSSRLRSSEKTLMPWIDDCVRKREKAISNGMLSENPEGDGAQTDGGDMDSEGYGDEEIYIISDEDDDDDGIEMPSGPGARMTAKQRAKMEEKARKEEIKRKKEEIKRKQKLAKMGVDLDEISSSTEDEGWFGGWFSEPKKPKRGADEGETVDKTDSKEDKKEDGKKKDDKKKDDKKKDDKKNKKDVPKFNLDELSDDSSDEGKKSSWGYMLGLSGGGSAAAAAPAGPADTPADPPALAAKDSGKKGKKK